MSIKTCANIHVARDVARKQSSWREDALIMKMDHGLIVVPFDIFAGHPNSLEWWSGGFMMTSTFGAKPQTAVASNA